MSTFTRVNTITRDDYMPYVVDTILNSNVMVQRFFKKAEKWSGPQKRYPIKYQKNPNSGSFTGFDLLGTTSINTRVQAIFTPTFFHQDVALPMTDIAINSTKDQIIDLVKLELASSTEDMVDSLGDIFYADGTGNSSKDFLGLDALVDDGTITPTIGGLSRTTYPTLVSPVVSPVGGLLSLKYMAQLWDAVTSGAQRPTIMSTEEAVFSYYEQLRTPVEKYEIPSSVSADKALIGNAGYTELTYRGIAILKDEKTPSGRFYMLNEKYIHWVMLPFTELGSEPIEYSPVDIEGNDYDTALKGLGFSWSGWIKPVNQAALVGHIYLGGNFTTDNPKRSGKFLGISGV